MKRKKFLAYDMIKFEECSKDCSDLHTVEEYARQTPFGECIVYGGLGVLACLSELQIEQNQRISYLKAEYKMPFFLDNEYEIKNTKNIDGIQEISMYQDEKEILRVCISLEGRMSRFDDQHIDMLNISQDIDFVAKSIEYDDYNGQITYQGEYGCEEKRLEELRKHYELSGCIDFFTLQTILQFSYISGMVIPGEAGMSLGIEMKIEESVKSERAGKVQFVAKKKSYERDYGILQADIEIISQEEKVCEGTLTALVRENVPEIDMNILATHAAEHEELLKGKTVLITGGSRGLGAALSMGLALRSCHVILNYYKSHKMAHELKKKLTELGCKVDLDCGDITSEKYLKELRDRIIHKHGNLDILVLNAFPSIQGRTINYSQKKSLSVNTSINISYMERPYKAFQELLEQSAGSVIIVSAKVVEDDNDCSRFRAEKLALEDVVNKSLLNHESRIKHVLVRPEKMRTDMTNTPIEAVNCKTREEEAVMILNELCNIEKRENNNNSTKKVSKQDGVEKRIIITSTFTVETIMSVLDFWKDYLDLNVHIKLSGYNQVFQELLSPDSMFSKNTDGMNVLMLKIDDWLRYQPDGVSDIQKYLDDCMQELFGAIKEFIDREQAVVPFVFFLCPSNGNVKRQEDGLVKFLSLYPQIQFVHYKDVQHLYKLKDVYDSIRDQMGHIPYVQDYYNVLGAMIVRNYIAFNSKAYKVIVTDCDNTLWKGICGEDGAEAVSVTGSYLAYQNFLVNKYKEGYLICLCSKNDEASVWEVFDKHPEMPLRPEHIVCSKINWEEKWINIVELAETLNLGLDSFVFVDDNPVECAKVRENCPEVMVLEDQKMENEDADYLNHLWILDKYKTTAEDKKRTDMYKMNVNAQKLKENSTSFEDFLKNLNIVIEYSEVNENTIARVAQLYGRTNQFNFTTVRWTEGDITRQIEQGHTCITVNIKDKFGDYGIVGVMDLFEDDRSIVVDAFLLSCRVLGRGVEHQMMKYLGNLAKEKGKNSVTVLFRHTEKNLPAFDFLKTIGAEFMTGTDEIRMIIPIDILTSLRMEYKKDVASSKRKSDRKLIRKCISEKQVVEIAKELSNMNILTERIEQYEKGNSEQASKKETKSVLEEVKNIIATFLNIDSSQLDIDAPIDKYISGSINVINVTSLLNKKFNAVPITILFEMKTIKKVAEYIEKNVQARQENEKEERKTHKAKRKICTSPKKEKDAVSEGEKSNDIAIVGMSFKYPDADTKEEFWNNLQDGVCSIKEITNEHWDTKKHYSNESEVVGKSYCNMGGFIENVEDFDASFFQISPKQAELMDPQQRLFLEVVWKLLEDAGYTRESIDRNTGVFVGMVSNDYAMYANEAALYGEGGLRYTDYYQVPNRISFFFDFNGPSMAVDTACSSSGTALALACDSLKRGQCNSAVVGGINLFLHPSRHIQYSQMRMLSPEGACVPFSADAKGTIFGEGIGAILVKRLEDAKRDRDNIYGVIKGYAINSGGRTNGFTVPNPAAQADLVMKALENANVSPATISYIETHGTGTPLGDPIEIRGLENAFEETAKKNGEILNKQFCSIGSLKGNIGHSESASLIASIIKVLLQMKHKKFVKSLSTGKLNTMIDFEQSCFFVQQENKEWERISVEIDGETKQVSRRAGVSAFGAGGSNAHFILEEYEQEEEALNVQADKNIFVFSAQNENSLEQYMKKFTDFLEKAEKDVQSEKLFTDIAYTLQVGREALNCRLAIIAENYEELKSKIASYLIGEKEDSIVFHDIGHQKDMYMKVFDGEAGDDFIQGLLRNEEYEKVAYIWTNGMKINWDSMYQDESVQRIAIPTYQFTHKKYSIRKKLKNGDKILSEMIDKVDMVSSLGDGIVFEKSFTKSNPITGCHVVLEKSILPGVAYVEMFLEAMELILPKKKVEITNVLWLEPVVVLDQETSVLVQVTSSKDMFELVMKAKDEETVYCKAYAKEIDVEEEQEVIQIAQIAENCKYKYSEAEIYSHYDKVGIHYGGYYQNLKSFQYNQAEAIGFIQLGRIGRAECADMKQYIPSMDGALQAAQLMLGSKKNALLPFCVSEVKVYSSLPGECYTYIKKISSDRLDVYVTDLDGKVCVKYTDICLRAAKNPLNEMVFVPRWVPVQNTEKEVVDRQDTGDVIIFYSRCAKTFKESFVRQFENRCVEEIELQSEKCSPLWSEDVLMEEKIEALYEILNQHKKIDSILYLGTMEAEEGDMRRASLEKMQVMGTSILFYLFKAISRANEITNNAKVKVISTNVFSVNGKERIKPFAAGVYGLCKSIRKEMPYLDVSVIDVDAHEVYAGGEEQRNRVAELVSANHRGKMETDFAIRSGYCYERVLMKTRLPRKEQSVFKKGGVYIIFGGSGGIGTKLAQYLAKEYEAKVVLVGRSLLSEQKKIELEEMKKLGGEVTYTSGDMTDLEQIKEVRDSVLQNYKRINGVFHSAIVLRDKSNERMSEIELREAMSPKVYGSYVLYQAFKELALDFMMFFSSTQAFASNPGQSNYAGGCSFKDSFASWMNQELDFPVKIINWGYWGNTGIVSSKEYNKRLANMGYYSVEAFEGMQGIEYLLNSAEPQAMICKISKQVQESLGVNTSIRVTEKQDWEKALLSQNNIKNIPTQEQRQELIVFNEGFSCLEKLGSDMLINLFLEHDIFTDKGAIYSIEHIRRVLHVIPGYYRLLDSFLHKMEKDELISVNASGYIVRKKLSIRPVDDLEAEKNMLLRKYECVKTQINLVWLCMSNAKSILSGEVKATDIMYPGSSMEKVAGIFKGNPNADYCNDLVSRNVQEYIKFRLPELGDGKKIRILEVGAGTGGTSSVVLRDIEQYAQYIEYIYTDISFAFTKYGRKEYGHYPFVQFKVLNIENNPQEQGYTSGEFDLIIATNVLHATKNIHNTLTNVKSLLKKNGWLVLNEITKVLKFDLFTFGYLDGWWLFEDAAFRMQDSPLLSIENWKKIFVDCGYDRANVSINNIQSQHELWQNVFIAESNGIIQEIEQVNKELVEEKPTIKDVPKKKKVVKQLVKRPKTIKKMVRKKVGTAQDKNTFVEEKIIQCICESLEMERGDIDFDKSFVEYGIDSILAVDLVNQVNNALGIILRTTVLFDYVNVDELTRFIVKNYEDKISVNAVEEVEEVVEVEEEIEVEIEVEQDEETYKTVCEETVIKHNAVSYEKLGDGKENAFGLVLDRPNAIEEIALSEVYVREPEENEVQIKVKAASINFGDILSVKGLYPNMPEYPFIPGFEVAGTVVKAGKNVSEFKSGEPVIALLNGTLGGHCSVVNCNEMYVCKKPEQISFEDASAFPVVFLTVWRAFEKAEVGYGDKVLIQTAAGGIGLIAVQLAKLRGAEIFATVGEQKKADYLSSMGVKHIINYRTEDFKERIQQMTENKGVDVVLNTLSGDSIQKGIDILAPEGRYVEIALTGLKAAGKLNLSHMLENQDFCSVDLSKFMKKNAVTAKKYMKIMEEYLKNGEIRPTVGAVFSIEDITEAYQYMENRSNIGKVVLTFPDATKEEKKETTEREYVPRENGDIAIIGIAGRFPGAENVDKYWKNLVNGRSEVREIPKERWEIDGFFDPTGEGEDTSYCKWGCFLDDIYKFDPLFFQISGKDAEYSEPTQRLFLEECYHALEDAGYAGDDVNGCKCGVFAGSNKGDYIFKMKAQGTRLEAQTFTGTEPSVLPARIAYYLNLKGPALTVDTACSSSLVAVHVACNSILAGDCDMAIAGGAFLMNAPDFMVLCSKTGMLSHSGICSAFDNRADGFVPGEGIGAIILKPYDKAVKDRDHIYGVIKGSGVNQDGRTNGLTAPSAASQAELEKAVYQKSQVDVKDITYIEAHGTGTILGDPIEFDALNSVFKESTDKKQYCAIGSVKTNIGHAAQAAGVASIIKVLMAMKNKRLCPSLNYEIANQYIDFENSPFYVNTESKEWDCEEGKLRTAAISSFGMSGTNCHMVIQEAPVNVQKEQIQKEAYLITLSAKSNHALKQKVREFEEWIVTGKTTESLRNVSFTLMEGRAHFNKRVAFVVRDWNELKEQICSLKNDNYDIEAYQRRMYGSKVNQDRAEMEKQIDMLSSLSGQEYQEAMKKLAGYYMSNGKAEWSKIFEEEQAGRVSLPGYPFERDEYCVQSEVIEVKKNSNKHVHHITGLEAYCMDHIVNGKKILPGVLSIDLACKYGEQLLEKEIHTLKNFVWAISIPVENPIDLEMDFEKEEGKIICKIKQDKKGTIFGQGEIVTDASRRKDFLGKELDVKAIKADMQQIDDDLYSIYEKNGIQYGSSLRVMKQLYGGEKQSLSYIQIPDMEEHFKLNPYGLDGILQTIIGTFTKEERQSNNPYIPFSIGEMNIYKTLPKEFYVYVAEKETKADSNAKDFDIYVCNTSGELLISIHDYFARQAKKKAADFQCYEFVWKEKALEVVESQLVDEKSLLVVGKNYEELLGLKDKYANVAFVTFADRYARLAETKYLLPLEKEEAFDRLLNDLEEIPDDILFLWESDERDIGNGYLYLMNLCKCIMKHKVRKQIRIMSIALDGQFYVEAQAGFAQCIKQENPHFRMKTVALGERGKLTAQLVIDEFEQEDWSNPIIRYQNHTRLVKINQLIKEPNQLRTMKFKTNGVYVITGGMGGLGKIFARYIMKNSHAAIILTGRRKYSDQQVAECFEDVAAQSNIQYVACDISNQKEVENLMEQIRATHGRITGVIHCAGVVRDAMIIKKAKEQAEEVFASKIKGLRYLYECTKKDNMDFLIACSSTAAVIGNAGQSDYAYANAYMDAFLEQKNMECHGNTKYISINWPLWENGGMIVDPKIQEEYFKKWGMRAMTHEQGLEAFELALNSGYGHIMAFAGEKEKLVEVLGMADTKLGTSGLKVVTEKKEGTAADLEDAMQYMKKVLERVIHIPAEKIMEDEPLETYGIDSMLIMSLTSELDKDFSDISRTLFFEYQTVKELAEYFSTNYAKELNHILGKEENVKEEQEHIVEPKEEKIPEVYQYLREKRSTIESNDAAKEQDIAIIGLSGRYPMAKDVSEFWENLKDGKDCVIEIDRWDNDKLFSPVKGEKGKTYSKWGGFIDDYDKFDPLFFNISPNEAEMMDPQERIFLETAWKTVEDAGYSRQNLWGRRVGVYVGVMYSQYQLFGAEENLKGNPVVPTASYASIANRVSYVFNFRGPSMAVDTMCSSSLTAIHLACESIKKGEIETAIAGGVNLSIHPAKYLMLSKGRFAASDGKCHSYGEGGDGYVPGEGVGAVMLKSLAKAKEDGDHIYGVIKASTLNHGGKTNGYTVPNPKAQESLIEDTLMKAGIAAQDISYVEGHGTGTALGDPIEVNSLASAYRGTKNPASRCALGSVKANIGHLESAAGIAALTKVLLQMKYHQIVPSIHSDRLNSNIKFDKIPFYVPQELEEWKEIDGKPLMAAISSFGAGGSNAHVIVEEYQMPMEQESVSKVQPQLIVLSAQTRENLIENANNMIEFLERTGVEKAVSEKNDADIISELLMLIAKLTECSQDALSSEDRLGELGFDQWQLHKITEQIFTRWNVAVSESELNGNTLGNIAHRIKREGNQGSMQKEGAVNGLSARLLEQYAYTLQVGREPMEVRLALLAQDETDIINKLGEFIAGKTEILDFWFGENDLQIRKESIDWEPFKNSEMNASILSQLAKKWCAGMRFDWSKLYANKQVNRVSLPTYSFTKEKYWMKMENDSMLTVNCEIKDYPMLGENKSTFGDYKFSKLLTGNERFVRDHVVQGEKVLPAVAYMEMALEAGAYLENKEGNLELQDVYFLKPWKVNSQDNKMEIHLQSGKEENRFTISAKAELCRGKVLCNKSQRTYEDWNIEALENKVAGKELQVDWYQKFRQNGIEYGKSFRSLHKVVLGNGEALASLVLEKVDEQDAMKVSLGILDGAFQCVTAFFYEEEALFLPFSIEKFELLATISEKIYVHIKEKSSTDESSKVFDITILSLSGKVLAVITGFCVKQMKSERKLSSAIRYLTSVWVDE